MANNPPAQPTTPLNTPQTPVTPSPATPLTPIQAHNEVRKQLAVLAVLATDPALQQLSTDLNVFFAQAYDPALSPTQRALVIDRIEQFHDALQKRLQIERDQQIRDIITLLVGVGAGAGFLGQVIGHLKKVLVQQLKSQQNSRNTNASDNSTLLTSPSAGSHSGSDSRSREAKPIDEYNKGKTATEAPVEKGCIEFAAARREDIKRAALEAAAEEQERKEHIQKVINHVLAIGQTNGGDGGALFEIITALLSPFGGISEAQAIARAEEIQKRVLKEQADATHA
jgi:hypothetical protein